MLSMESQAQSEDTVSRRKRRVAIAAAEDAQLLSAALEAGEEGLISPILFGNPRALERIEESHGLDLSPLPVYPCETPGEAARLAIKHIRGGGADVLMKGAIPTSEFLHAVLDTEDGLHSRAMRTHQGRRNDGLLSHVSVLKIPAWQRLLYITDAAFCIAPNLAEKVQLIQNAVVLMHALGVPQPKVAAVTAVEVVNPAMPATLDAAALADMNRRGEIQGCLVDGPLAMDLAISTAAAQRKGIDSPVAGQADLLLFPQIEAANAVVKTFVHAAGALLGGVVVGADAPIVLASRSDSRESILFSLKCAARLCDGSNATL